MELKLGQCKKRKITGDSVKETIKDLVHINKFKISKNSGLSAQITEPPDAKKYFHRGPQRIVRSLE